MFRTIERRHSLDKQYAERTHKLQILNMVLDGTIYDALPHEFHEERDGNGQYIKLADRAPSVRYGLCRIVVEDSVSLLFGDGHFPALNTGEGVVDDAIAAFVKATDLPATMTHAAMLGSVGSVAIVLRLIDGRVYFDPIRTTFLTPTWNPKAPRELLALTERYKVQGRQLAGIGYDIDPDQMNAWHWFQRQWTADEEIWFIPRPAMDDKPLVRDRKRTVKHLLGFCPAVWIRNLPGPSATGDDDDGACSFRPAIETAIEIDYMLSQGARGLKYSADPTLVLKDPAGTDDTITRSASTGIVVSEKGDAKLLEINGTAAAAVVDYVRTLRELALESIHGNRSDASRLAVPQSGRAIEMMNQGLIWLADRLRQSYGENGVLPLIRMAMKAAERYAVMLRPGERFAPPAVKHIELRWPRWYAPTPEEREYEARTLNVLRTGGMISRETAVHTIAPVYDIGDVPAEIKRIDADQAAEDARLAAEAAQVKATETVPS